MNRNYMLLMAAVASLNVGQISAAAAVAPAITCDGEVIVSERQLTDYVVSQIPTELFSAVKQMKAEAQGDAHEPIKQLIESYVGIMATRCCIEACLVVDARDKGRQDCTFEDRAEAVSTFERDLLETIRKDLDGASPEMMEQLLKNMEARYGIKAADIQREQIEAAAISEGLILYAQQVLERHTMTLPSKEMELRLAEAVRLTLQV